MYLLTFPIVSSCCRLFPCVPVSSVPMSPRVVCEAEPTPTDRDCRTVFSKSSLYDTVGPSSPEQLFAVGYFILSLVSPVSRLIVHVVYQCMC